jgi:hypothetical protein
LCLCVQWLVMETDTTVDRLIAFQFPGDLLPNYCGCPF